jgi:hypothetical protein
VAYGVPVLVVAVGWVVRWELARRGAARPVPVPVGAVPAGAIPAGAVPAGAIPAGPVPEALEPLPVMGEHFLDAGEPGFEESPVPAIPDDWREIRV